MKRMSYLNVVLSVNAVLLAAMLCVLLSGSSLGPSQASAQMGMARIGNGVPDAGAQRLRIIEALERIEATVAATRATLEDGRTRVEVTNLDDIEIDSK